MAPAKRLDAITDVTGIKVGHWSDRRGVTGCTVVLCEDGAVPGVDVRGGAPGTIETDALRPGYVVEAVNAVVLSGGSAFGLAAVDGVMRWCEEHGIGIAFAGQRIPIVAGAILFDLNVGRGRVRPDAASGYAAAAGAKSGRVAEGSVGAGTGATVAKLLGGGRSFKGGVGTASEDLGGGLIVGALVAVNAVGDIVDSSSGELIAAPRGPDGSFADSMRAVRERGATPSAGNTTIGVVATNARLSKEQAGRVASVAHDGLARAVRPAHTSTDGDTIFALATGEIDVLSARMLAIETLAAVAVERAIVKGVLAATTLGGIPSVRDWRKRAGDGAPVPRL
jgi:L-aminopeptidase/D-esterase-like protein